jgi:hypothetical protein
MAPVALVAALEPGVPILRGARDRVDHGESDQTLEGANKM